MKDKGLILIICFMLGFNIFGIYALYQTTIQYRKNMEYARSVTDSGESWSLQQDYEKMYIADMSTGFQILFVDVVIIATVRALEVKE